MKKETPVKKLYHGTRKNDPKNIYAGGEGFDILYSTGGSWGRALYFAAKSSYSNDFAYLTDQNERQMFEAQVNIGDTTILQRDKTIKMPPMKPDGFARYDSVQGFTGGSDVYMVYANKKAYPGYLITYRV